MKKITTLFLLLMLLHFSSEAQWKSKAAGYSLSPQKGINEMIAVNKNVAWALASERNNEFVNPLTDFTRTIDGGKHWIPGNLKDYPDQFLVGLAPISGTTAYVLSCDINFVGKLLKTTDGGLTWTNLTVAAYPAFYENIHFFNNREGVIIADTVVTSGKHYNAVYTTKNGGESWQQVPDKNLPADDIKGGSYIFSMSSVGDTIWTVSLTGKVWRSADKGKHWSAYQTPELHPVESNIKMRDGMHGLWGIENKLYRTTDGGMTWIKIHPKGTFFTYDLAYVPGTASAYVSTGGDVSGTGAIHGLGSSYTIDDGNTWVTIDTGVDHLAIDMVNTTTGFCGGFNTNTNNGVFMFKGIIPFEGLNSPGQKNNPVIKTVASKVFPNPFSNSTTISFSLLQSQKVSIQIFDKNGGLIKVLADENMQAGEHQLVWNAGDEKGNTVNAGIYLLRLQAGSHVETKKLVVVK